MRSKYIIFFSIISVLFCKDEIVDSKISESEVVSDLNILPFFGYIPAMGQLQNDKPIKALSITLLRTYWLNQYKKTKDSGNISDRNRSLWWLVALLLYGSIDAYIDSELGDFPEDTLLDSLMQNNFK